MPGFLVSGHIKIGVISYSCIRHTPTFGVQFWDKKVRFIHGWIRYSQCLAVFLELEEVGQVSERRTRGAVTNGDLWVVEDRQQTHLIHSSDSTLQVKKGRVERGEIEIERDRELERDRERREGERDRES